MAAQIKPSIVFCHGLWADGSCFSKVIPALQADGHEVIAAQYGLDTYGRTWRRETHAGSGQQPRHPRRSLVRRSHDHRRRNRRPRRRTGLHRRRRPRRPRDRAEPSSTSTRPTSSPMIEIADGRVWMLPDGVKYFAGDLPEAGAEAGLGDPLRAGCDLLQQQKLDGRRLEVEAELVHRRQERPHRASRPSALLAKRMGRDHDRGRQQPRHHALQARRRHRRDSQGRSCGSKKLIAKSRTVGRKQKRPSARRSLSYSRVAPRLLSNEAARVRISAGRALQEQSAPTWNRPPVCAPAFAGLSPAPS